MTSAIPDAEEQARMLRLRKEAEELVAGADRCVAAMEQYCKTSRDNLNAAVGKLAEIEDMLKGHQR